MRDLRLDALRGLALAMIFVNHGPPNVWQRLTSRNFGLSDAAEGFVLIAGIAAALAYGRWFVPGARPVAMVEGAGHVWRRVWLIYLVQILTTVLVLGVIAALAALYPGSGMLRHGSMPAFLLDPAGAMVRIPLLAQHLDYVDILPMYLVLLGAAPLLLWAAARWPVVVLTLSLALWAAAGVWRWNLPSHPNPNGWFFNPLAWQLLFVIGLLIGLAARAGRAVVPRHPVLMAFAGALLLAGLACQQWPPARDLFHGWLWQSGQDGWPPLLVSLDKTFLPLPRLLHVLVLAYVLAHSEWVRRACAARLAAPFRLLGRHGLAVFATGSVLAVGLQAFQLRGLVNYGVDSALVAGGMAVLFALAAVKDRWSRAPRTAAA